jgi:hypothetical protein
VRRVHGFRQIPEVVVTVEYVWGKFPSPALEQTIAAP